MNSRLLPFFAAVLFIPSIASAADLSAITAPKSGKAIFVAEKGKNKNAGTMDAPLKNIDKAIAKAKPGDTIVIAEGRYKGTFSVGLWELDKDLHI